MTLTLSIDEDEFKKLPKKVRVQFLIKPYEKKEWQDHVEQTNEYKTVTDLIKKSVRKEVYSPQDAFQDFLTGRKQIRKNLEKYKDKHQEIVKETIYKLSEEVMDDIELEELVHLISEYKSRLNYYYEVMIRKLEKANIV